MPTAKIGTTRFGAALALGAALVALSVRPSAAQASGPSWVSTYANGHSGGGVDVVAPYAIAATPDGVVVVGAGSDELRGTDGVAAGKVLDLGPGVDDGGTLSFVLATDRDGAARWAQPGATANAPFETYHVAAGPTATGDVVVTGEGVFEWIHPYRWALGSERVVGRSAADGSVIWSVRLGQLSDGPEGPIQSSAVAKGLAVYDGRVFVAGAFRDTLTLGDHTLVAESEGSEDYRERFDVFVASLDAATGETLWLRSVAVPDVPLRPDWPEMPMDRAHGRALLGWPGQMAFDAGPSGVVVGGLFPAGSFAGRGADDADGLVLADETALVQFGLDGSVDRAWTQAELSIDDDVIGPGDSNSTDSEDRSIAWPTVVSLAPDGGFILGWLFVPGRLIGEDFSHVEAGGVTYTDAAGVGSLVTQHGPDGAFGWAVALVTPQLAGQRPSRMGGSGSLALDVGPDGRVAVGTTFWGDDFRVAGARLVREGHEDGAVAVVTADGELRMLAHVADEPGVSADPDPQAPRQEVGAVAFGLDGRDLYVAGRFRGAVEPGDGVVYRSEGEGQLGVYLARYDLRGVVSTGDGPNAEPLTVVVGPNPATSSLRVSFGGATGPVSGRVLDVIGREVAQINHPRGEIIFDLSRWATGVYVVEARDEVSGQRAVQTVTVVR